MSYVKSPVGRHVRAVDEFAQGVLIAPDGRPVKAVSVYTNAAPPADGRAMTCVSKLLREGGPVEAVSFYDPGIIVTPDGRWVEAVELVDASGASTTLIGPVPTIAAIGGANFASGTNVRTPSYPAGLAVGDIVYLWVFLNDASGNATISSITGAFDWTVADVPLINDDTHRLVAKRIDDAAELAALPASETVTLSESVDTGNFCTKMFAIRGCKTTGVPFEAAATSAQAGGPTAYVGPNITTLGPNRLVLTLYGSSNAATSGVETNGWTEVWDENSLSGNDATYSCSSLAMPVAGAAGSNTRTMAFGVRNVSTAFAAIPVGG